MRDMKLSRFQRGFVKRGECLRCHLESWINKKQFCEKCAEAIYRSMNEVTL